MRILILICLSCFVTGNLYAQEVPNIIVEQQLENITENNEDVETEDDSYLQEMIQFQRNPVNINTAEEALLKELRVLSPMQIQNLVSYRTLLGKLVSIYELQAVPGWDLQTIRRIRPYIAVSNETRLIETIGTRIMQGDNSLLVRVSQTLEKSRGYLLDPATTKNYYPGSPQKVFVRFKHVY
ncbi:MAG: helix-hairpin-helix domain-containing protein, partial [Ferruginibacter sp.]